MSKYNKFSIETKLKRAKINKNQREIIYYSQILEYKAKKQKKLKTSKESIEKQSESKFVNPFRLANSRRKKLIENITPSEKYIKGILDILKVDYLFQHVKFTNKTQFYILDFYFPKLNICLELDGMHHYYDSKQLEHDKQRDIILLQKGIKTIRLSNDKALNLSLENIRTILDITKDIIFYICDI